MQAVNDNIIVTVKNNSAIVLLDGMKLTFNIIHQADAFVDDYYKRQGAKL